MYVCLSTFGIVFFLLCPLRTPWANFSAAFTEKVLQCRSLVRTLRYRVSFEDCLAGHRCLSTTSRIFTMSSGFVIQQPPAKLVQHHISTHSYIEIHFV